MAKIQNFPGPVSQGLRLQVGTSVEPTHDFLDLMGLSKEYLILYIKHMLEFCASVFLKKFRKCYNFFPQYKASSHKVTLTLVFIVCHA